MCNLCVAVLTPHILFRRKPLNCVNERTLAFKDLTSCMHAKILSIQLLQRYRFQDFRLRAYDSELFLTAQGFVNKVGRA